MAIWTEPAEVSTHGTLITLVGKQVYFESATVEAIASLSLTGSPRIYVETAITESISAVSAADVGSALGDVTNPVFTAVGAGIVGTVGQGEVTSPLPTITGAPFKAGDVTNPLSIISGTALLAFLGVGNSISAPSIVAGELRSGRFIVGSVQAPLSQVNATTGFIVLAQPSIPVVNAAGLTGRVGKGVVSLTPAQITGVSFQTAIWSGNVLAAKSIVSGEVVSGAINVGNIQNRLSIVNATGLNGTVNTGMIVMPLVEGDAVLISEVFLIGEILPLLPLVRGTIPNVISNFITWVLNTENNRASNYTEFPFIALGHMGNNPMGATVDGIYLLTGDDDEGQLIEATFRFGMTDFRSELANASDLYIGGDIEGDMEIGILEDGQDVENIYTISERERHVRGHHAKFGKGFRSRYRQLSISNVNGGNFELDSLSLSSRDLKGIEE